MLDRFPNFCYNYNMKQIDAQRKWVKEFKAEGFERNVVKGKYKYGRDNYEITQAKANQGYVELISYNIHIIVNYTFTNKKDTWLFANGHTFFKKGSIWCSFDHRGISDSFYVDGNPEKSAMEVIQFELDRIAKSLEVDKEMISIPGMKWRLHKNKVDDIKDLLKKGLSYSFYPRGFGIGEEIYSKINKHTRFDTVASPETAKFFGVNRLFISQFDHD